MKIKTILISSLSTLVLASCVGNHVGYETASEDLQFYVNKPQLQLNDVAAFSLIYKDAPVSEEVKVSYTSTAGAEVLESNKFIGSSVGEYTFTATYTDEKGEELISEPVVVTVKEADTQLHKKVFALYCTDESCKNCPSLAKALKKVDHENPNHLVVLGAHQQDHLSSPEQNQLINHFGITSLPTLVLDMDPKSKSNSTSDQIIAKKLESQLKKYPVDCGIGIETVLNGTELSVKVNLYNQKAQEYKIIVALLEDDIKAENQVGVSGDYYHKNVTRAFMTEPLGTSLGTVEAGEKSLDYQLTLDAGWNLTNCRVVATVLSLQGEEFLANNANDTYVGYSSPCQFELK